MRIYPLATALDFGQGTLLVVQSFSEISYGSSYLPAGSENSGFLVTCIAQVYDGFLVNSTAVFQIEVKKSQISFEVLGSLLATQMSSDGNVNADSTKQAIATVGLILNSVNCSGAPDCSSLNRY